MRREQRFLAVLFAGLASSLVAVPVLLALAPGTGGAPPAGSRLLAGEPQLEIVKTVTPTEVSNLVSETIGVTVEASNPGTSNLFDLSVDDSLAGALVCATGVLGPGLSTTCTGSYTIPAGVTYLFSNDTASATGQDAAGRTIGPALASASVRVIHPGISVTAVVSPTLVSDLASRVINISATVTDNGDSDLGGIVAIDSRAGGLACPSSSLASGTSMVCTGHYTIAAADPRAESNDTVNATGLDSLGNTVGPATSTASVEILHPAIGASCGCRGGPGGVAWTVVVTNLGDTALLVEVSDTLGHSYAGGSLAAGSSMMFSFTDLTSVAESDVVTVQGEDLLGETVTATASNACSPTPAAPCAPTGRPTPGEGYVLSLLAVPSTTVREGNVTLVLLYHGTSGTHVAQRATMLIVCGPPGTIRSHNPAFCAWGEPRWRYAGALPAFACARASGPSGCQGRFQVSFPETSSSTVRCTVTNGGTCLLGGQRATAPLGGSVTLTASARCRTPTCWTGGSGPLKSGNYGVDLAYISMLSACGAFVVAPEGPPSATGALTAFLLSVAEAGPSHDPGPLAGIAAAAVWIRRPEEPRPPP